MQELGLDTYLTSTPGIGGKLRSEPEDFQVIELGEGPAQVEGPFTAARLRLKNWETNRFAGLAANQLGIKRGQVAFAGMKDKRAVTEQWFTFRCPVDRLQQIQLNDVEVLEAYQTRKAHFQGAHKGNRFILRVREHNGDFEAVTAAVKQIQTAGGVPNIFGPQRFGGAFRALTHRIGEAIVAGDLEEAVRRYLGNPVATEREEARIARTVYEETRDPTKALEVWPRHLGPEMDMLRRLEKRPEDWAYCLGALPQNLLQLFIHAWQSYGFNHTIAARLDAGLGVNQAHIGDRVMALDDDGRNTVLVTPFNQAKIQGELDRGRAVLTAPLIGYDTTLAEGVPGAIERETLEKLHLNPDAFRCSAFPRTRSTGLRRGMLEPVRNLQWSAVDGDPVVSFALGRGSYATVVMREIMKSELEAY